MYNILFGKNRFGPLILRSLGWTEQDVGRFRDAFIVGEKIAIYTRLGGNNRLCYCDIEEGMHKGEEHWCFKSYIETLEGHANFLRYEDDDYDNTYATYYYSIPEPFKELLEPLSQKDFKPDERWAKKISELHDKSGEDLAAKYPEMQRLMEQVQEFLTSKNREGS